MNIQTYSDLSAFGEFVSNLWGLFPSIIQLLIISVFAFFILFGVLKLID